MRSVKAQGIISWISEKKYWVVPLNIQDKTIMSRSEFTQAEEDAVNSAKALSEIYKEPFVVLKVIHINTILS